MPTVRGWAALGVAAALTLLWLGFGEPELLGTAIFLATATAAGVAFTLAKMPRGSITRHIYPTQVHEGDHVVVEVILSTANRGSNLTVEDSVHGLGVARFAAGGSGVRQPLVARYDVFCRQRGIYQVGPAIVGVTDPLGLAERNAPVGSIDRLVVYPSMEDLEGLPAVRGYDGNVRTTRPTFVSYGGEDFFTLREYQVGDDLRKVHWPSSAKRDQLMIKQLEIPWQARALVLFDLRAGCYPGGDAFESAVRGAASAIGHFHRNGFSPALWAGAQATGLRAGNRFTQSMETLAGIQPLAEADLRSTVTRLRRSGMGGGALVCVTGTPDETVLAALRALSTDFTRTVVMAVTAPDARGVGALQRTGAVAVQIEPGGSWGPAWRSAMESSWSTASVG